MARADSKDFTLEKGLPSNIEAERAILGAILLDNGMINQAAERLRRDDFFLDSHRRIYEQMIQLYEGGRAIDPITLQETLRRSGELELIGGPAYVASLFDGVPRFANIDNYTKIVKDKAILRRLITASNQIMATCFDDEDEAEMILDNAERMILSIGEERIKQGFVPISEVAKKQLEYIEEIAGREQLITGVATGFTDLDFMTSGLQRGDLIIIAARPSMGKCLAADSEVVLSDGSILTIEEIYRRKQASLLTLGDNFRFRLAAPSAYIDDGIKPVYRVTTRLGRSVTSTATHPYLTIDGWRKLGELRVGDRIAVPRRIEVFGTERIADAQVKALAYMISERNLTRTTPSFTNTIPGLRDKSAVIRPDKTIPNLIFRLTRSQIALFLNQLFAINGWVTIGPDQNPVIGYSSSSERISRQIQHLLLRFGIIGRLHQRSIIYQNQPCQVWQLDITQAVSIREFVAVIGSIGKEEKLERALNQWSQHRDMIGSTNGSSPTVREGVMCTSDALPPGNATALTFPKATWSDLALFAREKSGAEHLHGQAESDLHWDEIVSIEYLGKKQVYDLTVPETHNFVANDICVHNTAFCLNIAQNAATRPQYNGRKAVVGIFSLEMSKEQLVHRLLCSQARIDAHRLRSGMLNKDDWKKLAYAVSDLAEAQIFLDDTPGINVLEMRAKTRRLKNEQKALDLLIVDYLQLMSGRGRNESRQQEVSQISRELKILAKELDVPLIALSQLSRAPEARTGNRPQLSDLRESGSIEQDADIVMFIYREDVYKPDTEKQNIAEIIIGKQRNGPTGSVELVFLKQLTRFEDKFRE